MGVSVADKIEIHELISRLYLALDNHKAEEWAACFAPDGVFEAKYGRFKGRAQIADFILCLRH